MAPDRSRRRFIAALTSLLFAGCLGGPSPGQKEQPSTADTATPTPTETSTPQVSEHAVTTVSQTHTGQQMIDRLPDPSPLASVLEDLVQADDRTQFAENHDIPYTDGTVKVHIELEEEGNAPESLLENIVSSYGTRVVAWVQVSNLVDVALAEDVRLVMRYSEPKTHDPEPK